jgi:hypothetical protein
MRGYKCCRKLNGVFIINSFLNSNDTINMFAIIAIVMAMGLVGVVAVDMITNLQNAEAKGCPNSVAINASQGRCFKP